MKKRGFEPNNMPIVYDYNNTGTNKELNELKKYKFLEERYNYLLKKEYQAVAFLPSCFPECLGYSYCVIVDVRTGQVLEFLKFH